MFVLIYLAKNMEKPALIHKYEGSNEFSLLNLKNGIIYFNPPSNFNDPYDCNSRFQLYLNDSDLQKYKKGEFPYHEDRSIEVQIDFNNTSNKDIKKMLFQSAKKVLDTSMRENRQKTGIACFSEVNDNILMWSHYANSCRGFCLEYDTSF